MLEGHENHQEKVLDEGFLLTRKGSCQRTMQLNLFAWVFSWVLGFQYLWVGAKQNLRQIEPIYSLQFFLPSLAVNNDVATSLICFVWRLNLQTTNAAFFPPNLMLKLFFWQYRKRKRYETSGDFFFLPLFVHVFSCPPCLIWLRHIQSQKRLTPQASWTISQPLRSTHSFHVGLMSFRPCSYDGKAVPMTRKLRNGTGSWSHLHRRRWTALMSWTKARFLASCGWKRRCWRFRMVSRTTVKLPLTAGFPKHRWGQSLECHLNILYLPIKNEYGLQQVK